MSYIAGRVGLVPKGEFNAATQYEKLDVITYQSKLYIAKVDNIPVGTLPTNSNYFLESFSLSGYATTEEVEARISPITNYKPEEPIIVGTFGDKTVYRQYFEKELDDSRTYDGSISAYIYKLYESSNSSEERTLLKYSAVLKELFDFSEAPNRTVVNSVCGVLPFNDEQDNKTVVYLDSYDKTILRRGSVFSYINEIRIIIPSLGRIGEASETTSYSVSGYYEYI